MKSFITLLTTLLLLTELGHAEEVKAIDLMSWSKLSAFSKEYKQIWKTISTNPKGSGSMTDAQRARSKELHTLISQEHQRRKTFYKSVKEDKHISDYPGILEKLNILYEKGFSKKGSKIYHITRQKL